MSNKHLKCNPHNITEKVWWYEENGGILVVFEPHERTTQVKIPWSKIRAALKRKAKP